MSQDGNVDISFTTNMQTTVYFGHDTRHSLNIDSGWTDTGQEIQTSGPSTMRLYAKTFPAGTITIDSSWDGGYDCWTIFITS